MVGFCGSSVMYFIAFRSNTTAFSDMYQYTHSKFPQWLIGIMFGAFMLDYQKDRTMYHIKNKVNTSVNRFYLHTGSTNAQCFLLQCFLYGYW